MERNGIVGNQTETRHVRAREFSRGKKKKRKKRKEKKRRKEKWSVLFRNEPANGTVRVIKLLWHVSGANCYACSRKFLNSKEQERETATRRERRASKGEAKRKEREERERDRERETKRKGQVASIWRPEFPGEKGNQKSKESLQIRGPECSAVAATWTRRTALLFTPEQCCLCRDVIKLWINFLLRWFYTGLSSIFEYSFSFLVTGPCFRFLSRWNAGRANNPTQPNVRSENVPRINRRFFFFPLTIDLSFRSTRFHLLARRRTLCKSYTKFRTGRNWKNRPLFRNDPTFSIPQECSRWKKEKGKKELRG